MTNVTLDPDKNEYIVLKQSEVGSTVPTRIQIVPIGEFKDGKGNPFRITAEIIAKIIANFDLRANDLVIDYEHQTLGEGQAPAAGWIKRLIDEGGNGLWAEVEWTARAKQYLQNREYRYLSPVLLARKKSDGVGLPEILHSAALTNDPAIDGMVPVVNKNRANDHSPLHNKENGVMKKLLQLLGLPETATEDQAVEVLVTLKAKAETPQVKEVLPKQVVSALSLGENATESEVTATILALKQTQTNVQNQEVIVLRKEIAEMKADGLVAKAMEDGKITAAQKDWAREYAVRDVKGFEVFVSKAPKVVPMEKIQGGPKDKSDAVDESVLLVAKAFGNSKDDLVKFGGYESKK